MPLAVDVVTVGAILVERVITSAVNDVSLVVMLGLLIILAAIHGYFALQVHHTVARKMENIDSNIDIIKQFLLHSYYGTNKVSSNISYGAMSVCYC